MQDLETDKARLRDRQIDSHRETKRQTNQDIETDTARLRERQSET